MPIYEYRCRSCGATTEQLRAMADADREARCACGAADSVRLPSLTMRPTQGGDLPMATGGGCCGGSCGCAG